MTLKPISHEQVHGLRDSLEDDLEGLVAKAIRVWLVDVRQAFLASLEGPDVLLAAAGDEMPGLGTVAGWWSEQVDSAVMDGVRAALDRAWSRWTDQRIEASPAEEATNAYLASVRDRLVQGTHLGVTVYEDSFGRIREALAVSAAEGWSRQELAQRISAELSWEKRGPYWRKELAKTDKKIDSILDAIGEPGDFNREYARLHDPRILRLRELRNGAIKHLDAERTVWQNRAMLIARTESTGGANFGAYQALLMEGVTTKVWLSVSDARTRASHAAANLQEVPVDGMFLVGGSLMRFPGDPTAPVGEVANCRCTLVGGEPGSEVEQDTSSDEWSGPSVGQNEWGGITPTEELSSELSRAENIRYELSKSYSIPSDTNEAWESYTSDLYEYMNGVERGNPPATLSPEELTRYKKYNDSLAGAIHSAPAISEDMYVMRGVQYMDMPKTGQFVADPAFLSTTTDLDVAAAFGDNGFVYVIKVPKGTKAVYGKLNEQELIFDRGTEIKILRVDKDTNTVYAEVVK